MNPKSLEARNRDDNPFKGLKISNSSTLDGVSNRSPCPRCGKSRMYFCYTCFVPVSCLEGRIPICSLPIKVDIIKHKREIDGKSTAAHAAVLAPGDVNVYTYPEIPEYVIDGRTVLLYPGTEARTVKELFTGKCNSQTYTENVLAQLPSGYNVGTLMTKIFSHNNGNNEIYHAEELPINRLVLIDSTWNQSRGIFADKRLQKIPQIVLQNRISQFWRHQKGSPRWYLSTIEALHQLLLELHMSAWGRSILYENELTKHFPIHTQENHTLCKPYDGQYDNLLYFFKYMYEKLHTLYKHDDLLAYKRPMEI
ncbi:tRNA-uridine aminocarboxypropyltransferase 1 [Vanessa tameamea]|uniref:tRNA-uridine aminocarboxypropyltransferase 1 n=1 Tax=Vanessa tameamea TaxID=334116 RepID=A0A8B8HKD8_VANTA|nr:DTW domain-containing protein 1 [Vanessa tameamea]